jgi:DNA-binding transcriptional LysR family regulator
VPDLNLTLVRYFMAVAEESSFTAAASLLHVSQPALSQAIMRLEKQLGTKLLVREAKGARRGLVLTAAGEALQSMATDLLLQADRVFAATRGADSIPQLRCGFTPATLRTLTNAVIQAADDLHGVHVSLVGVTESREVESLLDGRADMVILNGAADLADPQLSLIPLRPFDRFAVFPIGHRLAGEVVVTMADLSDEPIVDAAFDREFWLVDPRPDGRHPLVVGPPAATVAETLALVSAGIGMAIASAAVAVHHRSDELAFVRIADLEPGIAYLVTMRSDRRSGVLALRRHLHDVATGDTQVTALAAG